MVSPYGVCPDCHRTLYDEICDCGREDDHAVWCKRCRRYYPADDECPGCIEAAERKEEQ